MRWTMVFGGLSLLLIVACGEARPPSQLTTSGAQGGGGGKAKHTPPPDGKYVTEAEACTKLLSAFQDHKAKICGPGTDPICPQFLQAQYQVKCMFYDSGSVQGCIDYYQSINVCTELVADSCQLTTYPETAPAGCEP